MKLVLWSGATWLTEVIGIIYASYRIKSEPQWYEYLFYFPVAFNTLRGLGISIIIIMNSENKTKLIRSYHTWSSRVSTFMSTKKIKRNQTQRKSSATTGEPRRTSVSTIVTHVPDNNWSSGPIIRPEFHHSISEVILCSKSSQKSNISNGATSSDSTKL